MAEMKQVQILMSTYNGEKYLREQIDSLLRQTWPDIEILIRDDGSEDETLHILEYYETRYTNITVIRGENIGVTNSFFDLLRRSDAEYIAFCDQDDVWLEDKVEKAVEKLEQVQGAALYCSNKILVDADLNRIRENDRKQLKPGFGNAVVECICTGCTAVLNRELAENMKVHIPEKAILHDWWSYLVAAYMGQVIFDPEAYIWYRQHDRNEVGESPSTWGVVKAKARYLKNSRGKLRGQLNSFQKLYCEDKAKDALVDSILSSEQPAGKFRIVFSRKIYRQKKSDGLIMRALFLFNRML